LKRLGENVAALRKGQDQTNFTLGAITAQAVSALSALQAGLTAIGSSYVNFEYGVAQLGTMPNGAQNDGGQFVPIAGAFLSTPRIDPTSQTSTSTAQFLCSQAANCRPGTAFKMAVTAAVRSADPVANNKKSRIGCRFFLSGGGGVATSGEPAAQFTVNGSNPVIDIPRGKLGSSKVPTFPFAMTTEDNEILVSNSLKSTNNIGGAGSSQGVLATNGATYTLTLTCLNVPN